MRLKIIKYTLLLSLPLFIGLGYFFWPISIKAQSSDAIAIRIVENPEHYSSLRWYQSQKFSGSPQSLQIDGYDAVRDNHTAYVNVANVVGAGSGSDSSASSLYTNIFIISYTQDSQGQTADIFGQLIKNLKFNTNLGQEGVCNITKDLVCLSTTECPIGEYCNSQKAKTIRDVKRLSDLQEIRTKLDDYKNKNNNKYPAVKSGSYLSNKSISVWPSWQQTLASQLGSSLPVDPINKLGSCPGFDPLTCWDEKKQAFATDLSQSILPSGSHFYYYYGNDQGSFANYCTQTESGYKNIKVLNCFDDKLANNQPTIKAVNLSGQPKKEFIGYANISDPDGNPLKLSIDLVSPIPSTWLSKKWSWVSGLSKFQILPTFIDTQKKIYAPMTGNKDIEGYYKVRLTVDDGQGAANSTYSQIYDVQINPLVAFLEKSTKTTIIGKSESVSMSGLDINGEPIKNLVFQSASFEGTPLTQTELDTNGFAIREMGLLERFQPAQRTGVYTVNVKAANLNNVNSTFSYIITNNPPSFEKLVANFSNDTKQNCALPEKCSVSIDNGERASISILGQDPDGHKLSYSLVDSFNGALAINSVSGLITGLEKLNAQVIEDKTFNVGVKISDEYCGNSKQSECSSIYNFDLLVKRYCSVSVPASVLKAEYSQVIRINNSGEFLNTGLNLSNCSAIGSSTVDIKFIGQAHSQAIVLVSDVSGSMSSNVTVNGTNIPAINRLKTALITPNTGFLDRIYNIVKDWPSDLFVKIGLVAYSKTTSEYPLTNLVAAGSLANLKGRVSNYYTQSETNTLLGLNKAEELLSSIQDSSIEKIIILMSDGIPGIDGSKWVDYGCYTPDPPTCFCGYTASGGCVPYISCAADEYISSCTTCAKQTCGCGGTWGNCVDAEECPYPEMYQLGCKASDCRFPQNSVYNNFLDIKRFIGRLFNVNSVQAITTQTQCKAAASCAIAFPNTKCVAPAYHSCGYAGVYNCDLTPDVNTQAKALKESGVSIYTIYYNTSNTTLPKQRMCNWSSSNGEYCDNNTYAFAGTDIDTMINKVLQRIVTKPKDVKIGAYPITDNKAGEIMSEDSFEISGLICGEIKPEIIFNNTGYLEFSNLKIDYCPAKLHP